jgi:hypothetical protein
LFLNSYGYYIATILLVYYYMTISYI